MLLENSLTLACVCGSLIFSFIFFKLLRIRNNLTFITKCLMYYFLVIGLVLSSRLVLLLLLNNSSVDPIDLCFGYFVTWLLSSILPYNWMLATLFCRFIYVRYAKDLLTHGISLLHHLVILLLVFYSVAPIFSFMLTSDWPQNMVQGKICSKTLINFDNEGLDFWLRPKIFTFIVGPTCIFWAWFFTHSAKRQRRKHSITSWQRNLMTMEQQKILLFHLISFRMLDQFLQILIQLNYEHLGVEESYKLWLYIQFAEIILVHILSSVWIFINAQQNFPEFDGFEGKDFPGKEKPQLPLPYQRRTQADMIIHVSEERDKVSQGGVRFIFVRSANDPQHEWTDDWMLLRYRFFLYFVSVICQDKAANHY